MTGFLLDTNILSDLARSSPGDAVSLWSDRQPAETLFISDVTIGELHKGIEKLPQSHRRREVEVWLERVLTVDFAGRILSTDRRIWATWGRLCGEALRRGEPLPAIDALLAATALEFDLTLATRDTRALRATGVKLYNPWRA